MSSPERLHHPKESNLLFPKLVRVAPHLMPVVERLEQDHMQGEGKVRELQHALLAWELVGESRREVFEAAARRYVSFYLQHMQTEEKDILPAAQQLLQAEDWKQLDAAFRHGARPAGRRHTRPALRPVVHPHRHRGTRAHWRRAQPGGPP